MKNDLVIFFRDQSCAVKIDSQDPVFYHNYPYRPYFYESITASFENPLVLEFEKYHLQDMIIEESFSRGEFSILQRFNYLTPLAVINAVQDRIYSLLRNFYLFKNTSRSNLKFHLLLDKDTPDAGVFLNFLEQLKNTYEIHMWDISSGSRTDSDRFLFTENRVCELQDFIRSHPGTIDLLVTNSYHFFPFLKKMYTLVLDHSIDERYFKSFFEVFSLKRKAAKTLKNTVLLSRNQGHERPSFNFSGYGSFNLDQLDVFIGMLWVWIFSSHHQEHACDDLFLRDVLLQKLFPRQSRTAS